MSSGTVLDGKYELIRVIGEGGMGTVYEARNRALPDRPVAVKVIKTGTDSPAAIAWFERERHALSLLNHSNV
ncbi:serine/threonine protein kinase, partial [Streptomyces caeruleatus]